jgi:hypothetical protein
MSIPWLPIDTLANEAISAIAELEKLGDAPRKWSCISQDVFDVESTRFQKKLKGLEHRRYTIPKIATALKLLGATWRLANYSYQFKFNAPEAILCWWPTTGSVIWQGKLGNLLTNVSIEEAILAYAEHAKADHMVPKNPTLPAPPACLVCGCANSSHTCEMCRGIQNDLCETCFPQAHWCEQ